MKRNSTYGGPQSQGQYGSRSPQQIRPNALQIPVSYQEKFWHGIHRNQTALPFPPAGQGLIRNQPDLQHPLHHSRILERNTASAGYNNSAQPSSSYLLRQGSYIEQPLDGRYRLDMALKRRRLGFAGAQLFPRQVLDPTTIQMGGGGTARYDTDESYRNQMYERPTVAPLGVMAPSRWSNSHCYPRNTGDFRMHSHANYEKRLGGGYSESATNTQQQPVVLHRQDFPHRAASQQLRPLPTAALQNTINPYGFQRSNIAVEAKATRIGSDNKAGMSAPPESLFHYRQYPGTLKTQIQSGKEVSRSLSKPSTTESLPFCCKYCNKALSCKSSLRRHMKLHTRRNLFYCDTCGRVRDSHQIHALCLYFCHSRFSVFCFCNGVTTVLSVNCTRVSVIEALWNRIHEYTQGRRYPQSNHTTLFCRIMLD